MESLEVVIRPYNAEIDDAYIYSSWSKYSWFSPQEPHTLPKGLFFKAKIAEIKKLLTAGDVKIACLKNTPFMLVGYIVAYEGKLSWICVKKDYHRQGIDALLKNSMKGRIHEDERGSGP